MVRGARLVAARPPDRLAGARPGRQVGAADRADRRRQDAGRLPAVADRTRRRAASASPGEAHRGIHTLYISPLKALAVDIERNLGKPVGEMGLPLTHGDPHRRHARPQAPAPETGAARHPAHHARAAGAADRRAAMPSASSPDLRYVVSTSCIRWSPPSAAICWRSAWRGCARSSRGLQTIGLSATVAEPDELRRWLVEPEPARRRCPS